MDQSFGSRLREQRERRQLPLAAIADDTKIKTSLLEGLERDDLSHWPTGIFRRSYVKAYARAIGLDADATLRDFLALYPEPAEEGAAALADSRGNGKTSTGARPPTRLGFLISSAVGVLPNRRTQARRTSDSAVAALAVVRSRAMDASATTPAPSHDLTPSTSPLTGPELAGVDRSGVDLSAVADLCARLSCAEDVSTVTAILADAASLLEAVGVIVWLWDPRALKLCPVLSHGYPSEVIARFPLVPRDAENGIAMAFRSASTCVIDADESGPGAVVVPLLTPSACAGVLALELRHRGETSETVRACAGILAAQLATIVGCTSLAQTGTA